MTGRLGIEIKLYVVQVTRTSCSTEFYVLWLRMLVWHKTEIIGLWYDDVFLLGVQVMFVTGCYIQIKNLFAAIVCHRNC